MKLSATERKDAQNRWQAKRRLNQRQWLKTYCNGKSAEAVIQAAMRGECKITWTRGTAAERTTK
jgi:hypothetical protein